MNTDIEKSRITEINQLHTEIGGYLMMTLDKAIRVGELLQEQKGGLKHGEWLPWVEGNLSFTSRTARNYMQTFKKKEYLKSENVSDLAGAYKTLANPYVVNTAEALTENLFGKISLDAFQVGLKEEGDKRRVKARAVPLGLIPQNGKRRIRLVTNREKKQVSISRGPDNNGFHLREHVNEIEKLPELQQVKQEAEARKAEIKKGIKQLEKEILALQEEEKWWPKEIEHLIKEHLDEKYGEAYLYIETADFQLTDEIYTELIKEKDEGKAIKNVLDLFAENKIKTLSRGSWGDLKLDIYSENGWAGRGHFLPAGGEWFKSGDEHRLEDVLGKAE